MHIHQLALSADTLRSPFQPDDERSTAKQSLPTPKKKDDVKEPKSAPQRRFTQTSYTDGEQQRRRRVDAAGSNQISYVNLRAMGSTDYAQWARDFYPVANAPP